GFALVTLSPPAIGPRVTDRDVTLVLDVSGSMSGEKIKQARAAGLQLLSTLGPSDRFRLIDFSTDVRTFRDEFASATAENVRAASRYLESLDASGSTNISGALDEALRPPAEQGVWVWYCSSPMGNRLSESGTLKLLPPECPG